MVLGSTDPQPTNVAEETLPLRRNGFSPFFAATTGGILIPQRSTGIYTPASARCGHLPTLISRLAKVSVAGLTLSIFGAHVLGG